MEGRELVDYRIAREKNGGRRDGGGDRVSAVAEKEELEAETAGLPRRMETGWCQRCATFTPPSSRMNELDMEDDS